ncbi:TadE/TadG family type IV pilus assembly protein [Nocardiopsis xinjiangensis]|uniref:TadE/TadG family type IV pilus assembly protein n=1 Tax=Nocardiopsis xinjiangensis TaxID=124285 RepID=UPI000476A88A|nr:TadE family protein [Nocardiopsis xinjiangensis]
MGSVVEHGAGRCKAPRSDHGGVIVEFAAVIPFLMLALALVWQVVLIGITSMYASHASSEAARQAAVTPDDTALVEEEARKRVRPPWDGEDMMDVDIVERDGDRFAQVSLSMPIFLPGAAGPWDVTGESAVVPEVDPLGGSGGGNGV